MNIDYGYWVGLFWGICVVRRYHLWVIHLQGLSPLRVNLANLGYAYHLIGLIIFSLLLCLFCNWCSAETTQHDKLRVIHLFWFPFRTCEFCELFHFCYLCHVLPFVRICRFLLDQK